MKAFILAIQGFHHTVKKCCLYSSSSSECSWKSAFWMKVYSDRMASNESNFLYTLHNTFIYILYVYILRPLPHEAYISFFSKVSVQCSLVKTCQVGVFVEQAFLFQTDVMLLMSFCLRVFNCQLSNSHRNSTIWWIQVYFQCLLYWRMHSREWQGMMDKRETGWHVWQWL